MKSIANKINNNLNEKKMTGIENQTHNAIQNMNRKMKNQNEIDWEQRRYEIAREIFTRCLSSSDGEMRAFCYRNIEDHAKDCVRAADALIEELQKK